MSNVANFRLLEELNAYMQGIPERWSWDQVSAFDDQAHMEQRGTDTDQLNLEFGILEKSTDDGRPYLNVYVSVYDFREGNGLGSAYQPLSNNFIWFQDGRLDTQCKQNFVPNPE